MERAESREKYDKLVDDLMGVWLHHHPTTTFAVRADVHEQFYDLVEAYIRDLNKEELTHIEGWGMPYEGWGE